ncbi:MAG: prepilin-type N-terminal cleavage/methylation domain-containing protein [Desulfuromonadales bacterium]
MMRRQEHGFTLLELLVAMTITAILLSTIYGVFSSVSRAKERVESGGEGYHQARVLFDRIGRELRGAYVLSGRPKTRLAGGLNEEQLPFLELSTTATTPFGGHRGGIAIVRYDLRADPEAERNQEGVIPRVLMRREYNLFDPEGEQRPGYRLATGLGEMTFRFYKDGDWREEWLSGRDGSPQMVEVTLSISVDGQPVPFRSTFEVPIIQ